MLYNVNRDQKERANKLMLFYASEPEEVSILSFGSVGVILGLKHTQTGDTLVSADASNDPTAGPLRDIKPPPAVISAAVIPQSYADLKPVQEALYSLQRTDPSVRIEADKEGQLLVHGLGALHLEIIEGRFRTRGKKSAYEKNLEKLRSEISDSHSNCDDRSLFPRT